MESTKSDDAQVKHSGPAPKPATLGVSAAYKAKRTVSFKDQCGNQSLHTVHHVESLKKYNATEEKGLSCFKCCML